MRTTLVQAGFAVDWMRDGELADVATNSTHYDAVLLDLNLPQRTGFEVIADLRGLGTCDIVVPWRCPNRAIRG